MSKWTHCICQQCWFEQNPGRKPVVLRFEEKNQCCFCARETDEGIFVRHNGAELICQGRCEHGGS